MSDGFAADRRQAIEEFATELSALRESVGRPSFRAMSGRSGCISHTTLHEAAQGNRLPTWETTVEFAKACGADPADFRERWQAANRAVNPPAPTTAAPPSPSPPPIAAPAEAAEPLAPAPSGLAAVDARTHETVDEPARSGRRRRTALLAAAVAVVVAGGAGVAWKASGDDRTPPLVQGQDTTATGTPLRLAASPTACPVTPTNPPWTPPVNKGDKAKFLGDITIPDCSTVKPGQTFRKVWRLRNVGSVPWTARTLQRVELPQGRNDCQTVERVRLPAARPGQQVDVAVEVTAPAKPGICVVRWMMKDDQDRVAFPGGRPVNFQVRVAG
ncbi:NBR1-Ig-like domain-containing protein [Luteipulveratus flavus]|uniref:NBR1-Ig-like domain-containing protein n=1 Tax=Luteipulveratus flavus TaxID=3031728 RepID=A0ABT6C9S7_9MICO|nr:NBR1-Ig-like domain-containing protein [Luteipulveratus sp. YIM 133296]MDF8265491.1 NBR1-Ig-like domain-containing protein [Luteipulveratus sp. YIM 133296]